MAKPRKASLDLEFSRDVLNRAKIWEIRNGAQFQFSYQTFDKAPPHHQKIATLWVSGRSVEQIALLYGSTGPDPLRRIKNILRHPPIAEHIAQQEELIRQAREEKLKDRLGAAEMSFAVAKALVKGKKTPAKVRLDGAKYLIDHDPLSRFTEKLDAQKDKVHDTDSLSEFFENHERLKLQSQKQQAIEVDAASKSCDTPVEQEAENAANSHDGATEERIQQDS